MLVYAVHVGGGGREGYGSTSTANGSATRLSGLTVLLFNFLSHRFEGFLDACRALGTSLQERHLVLLSQVLAISGTDLTLFLVVLVSN